MSFTLRVSHYHYSISDNTPYISAITVMNCFFGLEWEDSQNNLGVFLGDQDDTDAGVILKRSRSYIANYLPFIF